MPAFEYAALNAAGRRQKGVMQGDAPRAIRQKLREMGLIPLEVIEIAEKTPHARHFFFSEKLQHFFVFRRQLNSADLTLFTRQLATLISAAMPVEEALSAISEQTEKKQVKKVISAIHAQVREGHSLGVALGNFPTVFSPLYRASVAAGEQTGRLDHVLLRLADTTEKQQFIQQKIQQALIYPLIMLVISFSIIAFLLTTVVPKITGIFEDSGQALPVATQLLLQFNAVVLHDGIYILASLMLLFIFFKTLLHRKQSFKLAWHRFLLKLPLLGYRISLSNTAQFARTLGMLSTAGVSVLEAMRIATEVMHNDYIRQKIHWATQRVREGSAMHYTLKQTGCFTPISIHLIASGESSGQLESMLMKVADYQDQEITRTIEIGLSLFEPLLIVIMGGIILFIVLAVLLPIFSLNELVT